MNSKLAKGLTRTLAVIVSLLTVIDGILTVSAPWWLQQINQISFEDMRSILGGMFQGVRSGQSYPLYVSFTIICGLLCLGILLAARRILGRILRDEPFNIKNAGSLKNAGIFALSLTLVFIVKMTFSPSVLTLICSGAFLLFGLFLFVLAQLFTAAAQIKQENELTI